MFKYTSIKKLYSTSNQFSESAAKGFRQCECLIFIRIIECDEKNYRNSKVK